MPVYKGMELYVADADTELVKGATAVSYTHLDVYKRQVCAGRAAGAYIIT